MIGARGGDIEIAKTLPGLSQALLAAAADQATSRQELSRVQAQTAASLEATFAAIGNVGGPSASTSTDALLAAMSTTHAGSSAASTSEAADLRIAVDQLRAEVAAMRQENNAGHAANAGNTGRLVRVMDNVTAASGGDAIATVLAA